MALQVDNVWYVLDLDAPPRFGFSRGPDTDPTTGEQGESRRDWPPVGQDGFTVHWFDQGTAALPDTVEQIATNMANGTWRHFKNYASQRSGTWLITDMSRLMAEIRSLAATLPQGQRNQLLAWATFLETSPAVPRVGDPV
jgi:hypothetical protein